MTFLSESYKLRIQELSGIKTENSTRAASNDEFENNNKGIKPIFQTQRGSLYKKAPGLMVKLTVDKTEYENALIFLNKPHKNFIKYYSAEPMKTEGWYILSMEEIKELSDDEWAIVDLINNTLGITEYMLDDNKRWAFINELKRNPEWYEEEGSYSEVISILQDIHNMHKEANRRGIKLRDARSQNMGRTMDGRLVHFDMGAG